MSDIFHQIISLENLFAAWREFRSGKRGRMDVQLFERRLEDDLFTLHDELTSGNYRHGAYREFHIFDPKHRIIHKATVRDRRAHHAMHRILNPLFERSFIFDSYSCREGKGTHAAVRRLEVFARRVSKNYRENCWALKFDIKKFFDSVDHEILLDILRKKINDPQTMMLLENILGSYESRFRDRGGLLKDGRRIGIPIGNLTSQLFANVYMNAFDHFIKEDLKERYYLRYTDDAVILDQDPDRLKDLIPWIEAWLWRERRLELHPKKVEIRKLRQGIDFLGYVILPHYRVLRTKTKRRMMRRVNPLNLPSYLGVLEHCSGWELKERLYKHVTLA